MVKSKVMDKGGGTITAIKADIGKINSSGGVSIWKSISEKVFFSLALVVLSFVLLVHFWGRPTQNREIDINLASPQAPVGCVLSDWLDGNPSTVSLSILSLEQARKKNWRCYEHKLDIQVGAGYFVYRGAGIDENGQAFLVKKGTWWETHRIESFSLINDRLKLYLEYNPYRRTDFIIVEMFIYTFLVEGSIAVALYTMEYKKRHPHG